MNSDTTTSVDTTIGEALRREHELREFYEGSMRNVGYDAAGIFAELAAESHVRIARLEELRDDIRNLRVLWGGMVD